MRNINRLKVFGAMVAMVATSMAAPTPVLVFTRTQGGFAGASTDTLTVTLPDRLAIRSAIGERLIFERNFTLTEAEIDRVRSLTRPPRLPKILSKKDIHAVNASTFEARYKGEIVFSSSFDSVEGPRSLLRKQDINKQDKVRTLLLLYIDLQARYASPSR